MATAITGGRTRQKHRTRRVLLESAARLLANGQRPTVSELADAAGVSRRTAYRYFPTQQRLHADAALEGLRPLMESAIEAAAPGTGIRDIEARIDTLVENMQRMAIENEALLRTIIHETVLAIPAGAEPRRGRRRLDWIEAAVAPLRPRLGQAGYERLVSALALCTGIEALMVFRDICGLSNPALIKLSQWMCRTMVEKSMAERDAEASGGSRRKRSRS